MPTTLHTPLMSQTNAIHGIVMLGGLIVLGYAGDPLEYVIGTIAVAFGAINIVGGFMVTDRMLGMFARKPKPKADAKQRRGQVNDPPRSPQAGRHAATALYIVAFSLFIIGLKRGTHPTHRQARQPDRRRSAWRSPSSPPCCSTGWATGA